MDPNNSVLNSAAVPLLRPPPYRAPLGRRQRLARLDWSATFILSSGAILNGVTC